MTEVVVRVGEPFEAGLKRFNRRVTSAGILGDARRHRYHVKPSERATATGRGR